MNNKKWIGDVLRRVNPKPSGKDEMNLAEFPLAVAALRVPDGIKTLVFKDGEKELIIAGSDFYGLPAVLDTEVILGLIQLTKKQTQFDSEKPTINFTRYQLLQILKWPNEGKSYRRLDDSLNRWAGVTLYYNNCWYDKKSGKNGNAKIHIIESVFIIEGTAKSEESGDQRSLPLSSFTWNKAFMESFEAGNLKDIDVDMFFDLKQPASKQLYRFLDKRFWQNPSWTFDLYELAFERVGLNRTYGKNVAKIKAKLTPAIAELEEWKFLEPLPPERRFFKDGNGWKIRLSRHRSLAQTTEPEPEFIPILQLPPLASELEERGVSAKVAAELLKQFPAIFLEGKIEEFDWKMTQPKPPQKPAGWLVKSIREGYKADPHFIFRAEKQRQADAKARADAEERAARAQKAEAEAADAAERQAAEAYWLTLTADQQAQLKADAFAAGGETARQTYEILKPIKAGDGYLDRLRSDYVRELLRAGRPGEPA